MLYKIKPQCSNVDSRYVTTQEKRAWVIKFNGEFSTSIFIFSVDRGVDFSLPERLNSLKIGYIPGCWLQNRDVVLLVKWRGHSTAYQMVGMGSPLYCTNRCRSVWPKYTLDKCFISTAEVAILWKRFILKISSARRSVSSSSTTYRFFSLDMKGLILPMIFT